MARSAMLLILILGFLALFHGGAAVYQPPNMTDCLRAINVLPDPLEPGSGLPKGNYIAPAYGMTILGDTCMIFCATPRHDSGQALNPAIRPISVSEETTLVTRISTSSTSTSAGETTKIVTSISTTSTSSSSIAPSTTTKFITTDVTKFPGASNTMWIGGGDKPSTWWVVGGAHPSTVTTAPPSAVTSVITVPPKPAPAPSKVVKRQHVEPPTIPSMNDAVMLQQGSCLTLCPNAVLHSGIALASPTTGVKERGSKKGLNAAFIILAIVLPLIMAIAMMVMGVTMMKYRRRAEAYSINRGRNLGVDLGDYRTQK